MLWRGVYRGGSGSIESRQGEWQIGKELVGNEQWLFHASGFTSLADFLDAASAEALFSTALQGLAASGDAALSQYADALALHATWLQEQGATAQALDVLDQAITPKIQARHAAHYEVLSMNRRKVELLRARGLVDAAQTRWQQSREQALAQLGPQHPISALFAAPL